MSSEERVTSRSERKSRVPASRSFVDLAAVLQFVDRTVERGVPTRIAVTRAAKRFHLDRELVLAAHRAR